MKKLQKMLVLLLVIGIMMGVSVFTAGAVEATDVAQVNGTGYATLEEAIAEAEKVGGTVELLADVDVSATISITGTVTISGEHTINRKTADKMFTLGSNAQLTLDGGVVIDGGNNWTFDSDGYYADLEANKSLSTGAKNSYTASQEGGLVSTGSMFTLSGAAQLVMNKATIQNNYGVGLVDIPSASASFTVNDGALVQHIYGQVVSRGSASGLKGTWTVNGGKICDVYGHSTNGSLVDIRGGVVIINGGEFTGVRALGLNKNGNGMFQVYGESSRLIINGGNFHDNASFAPGGGWGGVVYLNVGGDFKMTGGYIEGLASNKTTALAVNYPTTMELLGGEIVVTQNTAGTYDSILYGNITIAEGMIIRGDGELRICGYKKDVADGQFVSNGELVINGTISTGHVQLRSEATVIGSGKVTSDVTIAADPDFSETEGDVVIAGAEWSGNVITVDSVGTDASLTVKEGADIHAGQIRVLESVDSGNYANATEAAKGQEITYTKEEGAKVSSPVLFYHRLTAAQKQSVVVTFDYNGGLDAYGWSGCQFTSAEAFAPTCPAPAKNGYILSGWKYAVDNNPECLTMDGTTAYAGETIGQSVRLIAQWSKCTVTYKYEGFVPENAPAVPKAQQYLVGEKVSIAAKPSMMGYTFYGWTDPCKTLENGKMPAHDVTLVGYWLPNNLNVDPPIGIKTDKEKGENNQYDVTIAVPGDGEAVKVHDEVILVIDGSYSLDTEWPKMKETINAIADKVLGGAGRTKMTIIAFGMGDNIFAEGIETVAELNAMLENMPKPGNLLYGRSSTNCEAGFNAALKYIQQHQKELSGVDVIFISDGKINTDEHEDIFDDPSKNWMSGLTDKQVAEYARWALMTWSYGGDAYYNSCDYIINGKAVPSPAFTKVFGGKTAAEVKAEYYDDTAEKFQANYQIYLDWADEVYTNVYKAAGLTRGEYYPISVVERAFVAYDKANGTRVQDLFYAYLNAGRTYDNQFTRTPEAAEKLAECELVNELYLVRYTNHWKGDWMTTVENAKYYSAANVAALVDVIQPLTTELSKTNYTDVVITDYMSKWVTLDPNSIYIKNDTTGEIIWTITENWKSETDRPTSKTPVTVEIVESNQYVADDGVTVETNQNGVLYKLTWNVKDDCLLRTDNYSLHYVVTVDTAEEGFVPGVEYPANGHTYVEYEENGKNNIAVPNVTVPAYTVTYMNGETTVQKTYPLTSGTAIPTCDEPDDYTEGDTTYTFSHWNLVSGTEGADDTVGITDLVYQAVFTISDDVIIDDGEAPKDPTPNVPTTGDNDELALAMFGMMISLAAIAVVLKNKKFFA